MLVATLSKEPVKEDKVAFRAQQMWIETAIPLAACLEKAHKGSLTVVEAIPMMQSALMLMGDTSQHQSSLRRKTLLQHLNPQLKYLMKDSDFSKGHPFLFGENFGEMAKAKLEAAAALKKAAYPTSKGSKQGFWEGYPQRNKWGHGGGRHSNYSPGRSKKNQPPAPSGGKPPVDKSAR